MLVERYRYKLSVDWPDDLPVTFAIDKCWSGTKQSETSRSPCSKHLENIVDGSFRRPLPRADGDDAIEPIVLG
jgi:hypothetical protein